LCRNGAFNLSSRLNGERMEETRFTSNYSNLTLQRMTSQISLKKLLFLI
jgi:hypothetical protein